MRKLAVSLALSAAVLFAAHANATQINAGSTGLTSPVSTITFDEVALTSGTPVTNQFAAYGATFSPFLYYSPQTGFPNIQGNDVGNFTFSTEPAFVNPFTITFSSALTGAAFAFVADGTPYTFTALLGGVPVDSFTATVGTSANDFYGFENESFDSITVALAGAGGGPYNLLDNLQLGAAATVTPEPSTLMLLGTGLLGAVGAVRKRFAK